MSKRFLDQIERNSDASSVEDVDTEALRLDKIPSPKRLFYEEEDDEYDEDHREHEEKNEEADYEAVNHPLEESISAKRVRFKRRQRDPEGDAEITNVRHWDFGPLIRQEFRDKLPSNYEIKRWKRPSKHMIRSLVQLLETNFETAIEQVFDKYNDELKSVVSDSTNVHQRKHIIMGNLVSKIRHQLKRTKFPSRISDRDVDIEYIVSKRKYIQSRYAQELENAEKLEDELIREEQKLREVKGICEDLQRSDKRKLQERLLKNDLHPSLIKAIENAYGLIPDSSQAEQGHNTYEKDIQELQLAPGKQTASTELDVEDFSDIEKLVPAIQEYNEVSENIHNNIEKFMALNKIESIQDRIDRNSGNNE